jgi:phenylpropionate dioxygenase-like ring-hydroxylating dioxygenase large terminal subunit
MLTSKYPELFAALRKAEGAGYDEGWSMPREYYTDPDLLAEERAHLFGTEWICIGRTEEVPDPGSFMALRLCDEPLVVVRGEDSRIRAFSNVCRHRGALIAEGRGRHSRLVCPYHHWSYDLEGKLAAAPEMERHALFDPATCRLPEYAVETWHGFLFVNLSEHPAPLAPRLKGLDGLIRNYHMEEMRLRYVADEIWETNWKCLIENFMEGYHLTPLHRTTLHPVNPTRLCSHFPPGEAYFGYNAGYSPELERSTRGHPDLSEAEVGNCVMFAIPPGLVSGCGGDYSSFVCVQPEAVDQVRAKLGLIFFGDHWTETEIAHAVKLFNETMDEDKAVLSNLLTGMRSRRYESGPLAPAALEGPVLDFYRFYSRRMRNRAQ